MGRILVGTASWTDKTLLESGWYPQDVKTPEQRLAFYAIAGGSAAAHTALAPRIAD